MIKGTYDKKQNADRARARIARNVKNKTCPVFMKKCLGNDCQSYSPGRVYTASIYSKPTVYRVFAACCSNAIVKGCIEMEMIQP